MYCSKHSISELVASVIGRMSGLFKPLGAAAVVLGLLISADSRASINFDVISQFKQYSVAISATASDRENRVRCAQFKSALTQASDSPVELTCSLANSDQVKKMGNYHFEWIDNPDGSSRLSVENLRPQFESDFKRGEWPIHSTDSEKKSLIVQKIVGNFVEFDKNKGLLRQFALDSGVHESKLVRKTEDGKYQRVADNQEVDFDEAYRLYETENSRQRHFLASTFELAGMLGAGSLWYYIKIKVNKLDWDYPFSLAGLKDKLTHGIRFDNNTGQFNTSNHPLAGAFYYDFWRSTGANSLEAFLIGFASSLVWETFSEWREVLSVNDMIFTSVPGAAIGEVLHQYAVFFAKSKNTVVNKTLGILFGNAETLNYWINDNKPKQFPLLDDSGFTADTWHQFDIFAGAFHGSSVAKTSSGSPHTKASSGFGVGVHTQIITIPEYEKPGQVSKLYSDTMFTELLAEGTFGVANGKTKYEDLHAFLKAVFAGYMKQDLSLDTAGSLKGYSFMVGAASAYDIGMHNWQTITKQPFHAIVNVLGPTMDVSIYRSGVKIRFTIDVYPDFAAIRSFAFESYTKKMGENLGVIRSVLTEHQYYYAFGVTVNAKMAVQFHDFEVGGSVNSSYLDSIQVLDRYQSQLTNNFRLSDAMNRYQAWISYAPFGDCLKIRLLYDQMDRWGSIGDIQNFESEKTVLGQLVFTF